MNMSEKKNRSPEKEKRTREFLGECVMAASSQILIMRHTHKLKKKIGLQKNLGLPTILG